MAGETVHQEPQANPHFFHEADRLQDVENRNNTKSNQL